MFRLCAFLSILLSTLALWHFLPQFLRHNLALGALLPTSTLNGYLIMQHSKLFAPLWGGSEQRNGSPPASIISYQTSTTVVQLKLNSYSMHTTELVLFYVWILRESQLVLVLASINNTKRVLRSQLVRGVLARITNK